MKKNLSKHRKMSQAKIEAATKLRRTPTVADKKLPKPDKPQRPHEWLGFDTADLDGQ